MASRGASGSLPCSSVSNACAACPRTAGRVKTSARFADSCARLVADAAMAAAASGPTPGTWHMAACIRCCSTGCCQRRCGAQGDVCGACSPTCMTASCRVTVPPSLAPRALHSNKGLASHPAACQRRSDITDVIRSLLHGRHQVQPQPRVAQQDGRSHCRQRTLRLAPAVRNDPCVTTGPDHHARLHDTAHMNHSRCDGAASQRCRQPLQQQHHRTMAVHVQRLSRELHRRASCQRRGEITALQRRPIG